MKSRKDNELKNLFLELQSIENRGVTIWIDGKASTPYETANKVVVSEECSYMRDYIFEEGSLKEIRFDKIQ